jgi:hypothetical protein
MRSLAVAVVFACALVLWVTPASASSRVQFGIQDDAWLEFGPGKLADRVAILDRLGVDVVRVTLKWHEIEVSPGRYRWRRPDRLLGALRRQGLEPVVTLWGTPSWANGGTPNTAPARGEHFNRFANAVAARYLFVRKWVLWNEPNKAIWLKPVSPKLYVQRILNPGYRGIKQVNPDARVAGGATGPRGGKGGMAPVDFIRAMDRAGARLDAFAHHPYPDNASETPFEGGCDHCKTITMATLERLLGEVGRAFPRARIWLTEYAYQTRPPDPFGVSLATQARFVAEAARRVHAAPKVDMLIHYLYRDEPDLGRWQSGLETIDGQPKLAMVATMLPLAQVSRRGSRTTLWGQVRPGKGRQRFFLQTLSGGRWIAVGRARLTDTRGYLRLTVQARRGNLFRLSYPARRLASPALVVR